MIMVRLRIDSVNLELEELGAFRVYGLWKLAMLTMHDIVEINHILCGCDGIFLCIIFVSKRTCLMLQNMFFMVVVVIFFSLILLLITNFFCVLMYFFAASYDDLACLCLKTDVFDVAKHVLCGSCCLFLLLDIVVDCHFFSVCWCLSLLLLVMT